MAWITYLLQSTSIMAAGYGLYYLLLRRLTFFTANRVFLLGIILTATVLPLISITIYKELPAETPIIPATVTPGYFAEKETTIAGGTIHQSTNWLLLLQYSYLLITACMLARLCYGVTRLLRNARRRGRKTGRLVIVNGAGPTSASFFHYIFYPASGLSSNERRQVLQHECIHARLLHSADKLLIEMLRAFYWFNPFVTMIGKALEQVHEYQVDSRLAQTVPVKNYATLILKLAAGKNQTALVNAFTACSIKNRLTMLFTPRSVKVNRLLYAAAIPCVAVFLYSFSVKWQYSAPSVQKPLTLILDAGHGGADKGAIGAGDAAEKDITLPLTLAIAAEAEKAGIHVVLTRPEDKTLSLPERIKPEGDIFVSIHVSASDDKAGKMHGAEVIVPDFTPRTMKLATAMKQGLEAVPALTRKDTVSVHSTVKNVYVLKNNPLPSVLLEVGYMTNARDLAYISAQTNQQFIARKLVAALNSYRAQ